MSDSISRMQFLSGDLSGKNTPIRPPWALPEAEFLDACDRCGDCVPVCESGLIKVRRGGFPQMDFSVGGCDFCQDCVKVCKRGALKFSQGSDSEPWTHKATILSTCLSLNSIICRSCGEACDAEAIRFQLEVGGVARPLLDLGKCNGCGECYAVCPDNAVMITRLNTQDEAA